MIQKIRIGLLVGWIAAVAYIFINSFLEGRSLELYIYWAILLGLLYFIWQWRKNSRFSLYSSFALFLVSALVVIVGFKGVGEFIMRVSFIFLLVGFVQAFLEYRTVNHS